jgi:hypothetical protein
MFHSFTLPYWYAGAVGPFPVLGLSLAGVALCLSGGFLLAQHAPGVRLPRFLDALTRSDSGEGFGDSLLLGLGAGLLGSSAFEVVQSHLGHFMFLPPTSLAGGLLAGLGLSILLGALGGRLHQYPRSLVIGVGAGIAGSFVLFRLLFGATAGYGPSVGEGVEGVGVEVALVFGLLGALVGAFLATVVRRARGGQAYWWRRILVGAGAGLATGVVVALIGTLSGQFLFLLPYVPPESSPAHDIVAALAQTRMPGLVYGFSLFASAGALLGGVGGGLGSKGQQARSSNTTTASPLGQSERVGGALGLLLGLLGGLAVGLSLRGPSQFLAPTVPWNPQAGIVGLLVGGVLGLVAGIGIAVIWNRADQPGSDQARAQGGRNRGQGAGIALLVIGVVLLLLPYWFLPLFGLNILYL